MFSIQFLLKISKKFVFKTPKFFLWQYKILLCIRSDLVSLRHYPMIADCRTLEAGNFKNALKPSLWLTKVKLDHTVNIFTSSTYDTSRNSQFPLTEYKYTQHITALYKFWLMTNSSVHQKLVLRFTCNKVGGRMFLCMQCVAYICHDCIGCNKQIDTHWQHWHKQLLHIKKTQAFLTALM